MSELIPPTAEELANWSVIYEKVELTEQEMIDAYTLPPPRLRIPLIPDNIQLGEE